MSKEDEAYNKGLDDAIDCLQEARLEGESDMRQVITWVRDLYKGDSK